MEPDLQISSKVSLLKLPLCRLGKERHLVENAVLFCPWFQYVIPHGRQHNLKCPRLCYPQRASRSGRIRTIQRQVFNQNSRCMRCLEQTAGLHRYCYTAPRCVEGHCFDQGHAGQNLLADKGYDSDEIRLLAIENEMIGHIPLCANSEQGCLYDERFYKTWQKIENQFGLLKYSRALLARYGKLKGKFSAFLHFVLLLFNG